MNRPGTFELAGKWLLMRLTMEEPPTAAGRFEGGRTVVACKLVDMVGFVSVMERE